MNCAITDENHNRKAFETMRSAFLVGPALGCLFLSACQTPVAYQRIGYGPDLEYAKAECANGSMSVERGYFAMGSPGYVLGASLGNAIGNAARKSEYVQNCMIMRGWRPVSAGQLEAMKTSKPILNPTPAVDAKGQVVPQAALARQTYTQQTTTQRQSQNGIAPPPLVLSTSQ